MYLLSLSNTNFSSYPIIYTGKDVGFQDCISYLKFALPSLPVTAVDSALLQLTVIIKTGTPPSPIVVNRVTTPFNTSTVNYNTRPAFVATSSQINITPSDVYTSVQIDITPLVNEWLAGTFPNNGIALTDSDGTTLVVFATESINYEPYFPKLIINYSITPVETTGPYAYIYNTGNQSIPTEGSIPFSSNGALLGISHNAGAGPITIETAGTYAVWFIVTGQLDNQLALFQNGLLVPGSIYGTDVATSSNSGIVMINANAGDILTLRNHTSTGPIILDNSAGGTQTNVSASITLLKVGPQTSPNPALVAVNTAQNITDLRVAIENPALGLNLTVYNTLTISIQNQVLSQILSNRPTLGYPTVSSLQVELNNDINQVVDPNNIYVKAGSVGGDGSIANPFGTISQGITAVSIGGKVHILAGTYPITSQIGVNKANITLLGESGTMLLLQANLIAMLITGSGVTVQGLTITSNVPYANEFIQIGAPNVRLINNTVYGPAQPLPMSSWVVNRAVVSQVSTSNVLLDGNTFYSLRTGMYINPNTTGAINNNAVYNTKGGFLVDGAFTTFVGNSWGVPANDVDIVLLVGTTTGVPYNNLAALSAANNNATISDQR